MSMETVGLQIWELQNRVDTLENSNEGMVSRIKELESICTRILEAVTVLDSKVNSKITHDDLCEELSHRCL